MKKAKITRALLCAALCLPLLSGMAITGSAKNTKAEVRWGTAVVDAKLDAAYLRSASTELGNPFFCPWNLSGNEDETPHKEDADVKATSYFLWSEDYFYTCTIVKDNDVFKRDASYYTTSYPWEDDGIEGWYSMNRKTFGLHCESNGVVMYAYMGTSNGGLDAFCDVPAIGADFSKPALSNIECKSKVATAITSDGYIIETALKLKDDAQFKVGDEMKYGLQVNDMFDAEGQRGYAIGTQDPFNSGITMTFVEKTDDDVAACAVAAADPENPSAGETPAASNDGQNSNVGAKVENGGNGTGSAAGTAAKTANPGTSDAGVYACAALVMSATAFIIISKSINKKH